MACECGQHAPSHEAYDKIVLGGPREAKLRPDEAERVAVHESGHAVVALFSASAELPRRDDHPAWFEVEHPFLGQRIATDRGISDATTHSIEREARDILAQALATASRQLVEHRSSLDRLTHALLERETPEAAALEALLAASAAALSA